MSICIYIYIYMYMYVYIYIYIYTLYYATQNALWRPQPPSLSRARRREV